MWLMKIAVKHKLKSMLILRSPQALYRDFYKWLGRPEMLKMHGKQLEGISTGDGAIDAAFNSIEKATGRHFELDDFQIQSVTEGREAMGETIVRLRSEGKLYSGKGISTDIVGAGIMAYINALNKIIYEEEEA